MSFEFDLSSVICPKCHTTSSNDNLEVIGLHVFTLDDGDKLPYYDIECQSCFEVFTKGAPLCLKDT
ncbi:hypothetical protein [Candidatus Nitrosocosmicus franklandus]|uniref:Methyltransferase putative zinc binding domain-containing protein n=1 Tax=Candidatus Nitrosocosmicus franklandianus TaxID=1798806 RepID=A0A484I5L8_9ARCH|nr:hypothetical protein [Candidatus Nitrosocosmicus franklandus]VFJ12391.1 protein of unknown function [Candidatus Nitrosocosmicus franklandus]